MTDEPDAKRPRLSKLELDAMTKEDLVAHLLKQYQYSDSLEAQSSEHRDSSELVSLRESEEKLKQQQQEATRRENVLVMRLTAKEQEMQEYANQIQELRQAQIPGIAQLRSALLDPTVNLMFDRMKKELEAMKTKLEETQNDLSAWKFTPDSNTGKRLMAKCRLLYQENEELGKMISSGRIAKMEGDLALQRNFSEEMKKSQADLDCFVMELDGDMEGLQSTIYYLQQQLRDSKENAAKLQLENRRLTANLSSLNGGESGNEVQQPASWMYTNHSNKELPHGERRTSPRRRMETESSVETEIEMETERALVIDDTVSRDSTSLGSRPSEVEVDVEEDVVDEMETCNEKTMSESPRKREAEPEEPVTAVETAVTSTVDSSPSPVNGNLVVDEDVPEEESRLTLDNEAKCKVEDVVDVVTSGKQDGGEKEEIRNGETVSNMSDGEM